MADESFNTLSIADCVYSNSSEPIDLFIASQSRLLTYFPDKFFEELYHLFLENPSTLKYCTISEVEKYVDTMISKLPEDIKISKDTFDKILTECVKSNQKRFAYTALCNDIEGIVHKENT